MEGKVTAMVKRLMRENKLIQILYAIGMVGMLSILLLICITKEEYAVTEKDVTYIDITKYWTIDKDGNRTVDILDLGEYMDEDVGKLSIYFQLPKLEEDISLVYRSKDVYTKVLIDDEIVYQTKVYESEFYNESPGNLWNVLTINSKYSEKCVELQIFMLYDTHTITVDSILFGDKADIILGIVQNNLFGIIISLVLSLAGVVFMMVDFLPSYEISKKIMGYFG